MTRESGPLLIWGIQDPKASLGEAELDERVLISIRHILQPYKSAGPDRVHAPVPKESICICYWRQANIRLVFKEGRRTDPKNCRPILIAWQVVNMLERLSLRVQ